MLAIANPNSKKFDHNHPEVYKRVIAYQPVRVRFKVVPDLILSNINGGKFADKAAFLVGLQDPAN